MSEHLESILNGTHGAWRLTQPEPSEWVAPAPGPEPPSLQGVAERLAAVTGIALELRDTECADDDDVAWSVMFTLPGFPAPLACWVEPARPDVDVGVAADWVLAIQTLLDADDPLPTYRAALGLLIAAVPETPAVLDVSTAVWYSRADADALFLDEEVEPPDEILWTIHAAHREGLREGAWIHTHGLWRCGHPELEMLDVPVARVEAAAIFMADIASLVLERPLPAPGATYPIGRDLAVAVRSWEDAACERPSGAPGSIDDRRREGMEAHRGARAVLDGVCEALDRIEAGTAAIYRSQRVTARRAQAARSRWPEFAELFTLAAPLRAADEAKSDGERSIVFLIEAALGEPAPGADREHLWYEVRALEGDTVRATLARGSGSNGGEVELERGCISGWTILTATAVYGPDETRDARLVIADMLRASGART